MKVRVTLIAVGTELVALGRRDTNSEWLASRVARLGHEVEQTIRVSDDAGIQAAAFLPALERGSVVITTGGLGPTEDDLTREAVARATGTVLELDSIRLELLRRRFEERGFTFGPGQARQAQRPPGAVWIDNPLGSAPGLEIDHGRGRLFALPGVPMEMRAMFEAHVEPRLGSTGSGHHRVLRIASRGEGDVDERLKDLYGHPGLSVTILAHPGQLELHLRAIDAGAAGRIDEVEAEVRERLGAAVYGVDDDTLPGVVGAALATRRETVGTAESCTAGLIAAALTDAPGSSEWFQGALVVYNDELKMSLAGVSGETLTRHGAVSEAVARELAAGARGKTGADWGIGVTGIAGPGGGSAEKPVGTVHIGIAGRENEGDVSHRLHRFHGDRDQIRRRTVNAALDGLRRLLGAAG